MSSTYLGITLLSSSQSSKYLTVNAAINALAAALAGALTVAMADANQTLSTANANGYLAFNCTGADTADRNLIVPAAQKVYAVKNSTTGGHNIVCKTSGGTGITIPSGSGWVLLYCDGTNVVEFQASASAIAFTNLTDAPGSYSGDGGYAVEVNSGATALQFSPKPLDVAVFAPGLGSNSQKLARVKIARACTFPAGAANSFASASAAATGSTVFTLKQNGTSFATVTFAASATSGTWSQASAATFAAGDLLEIDGPSTADATLADVGITLYGQRA